MMEAQSNSKAELNDEELIRSAIRLAQQARDRGNHPFGALLVSFDGEVLCEAENTVETEKDVTGHAELNLVRKASKKFDKETLKRSILYTSTEPCSMCSGAIFWGSIPVVVYGLPESGLYEIVEKATGSKEYSLRMPSRELFARGIPKVDVRGPVLLEEAQKVHEGFWENMQGD